jgi:hypothetical protein
LSIAPGTFKFSYISVPISTRRFVFPIHSFACRDPSDNGTPALQHKLHAEIAGRQCDIRYQNVLF